MQVRKYIFPFLISTHSLFLSLGHGHYVAHVKAEEGQFYRVDDSRPIRPSTLADIEKSQLFLYRYKPFNESSESDEEMFA